MTLLDKFYIASATIGKANNFTQFGLTDCGIMEVARDKYLVLTDDLKLANYLAATGIDALNFNHFRPSMWR
ncbi:MAG: hypothetical protein ACRCU2_03115 [Planktothrix sp.]